MKIRIIIWLLVAIFAYWIAKILLAMVNVQFGLSFIALYAARWLPLLFWACLVAIHIALCFFIWRDARSRSDLLFSIPDWVWGLIGLTGGVLGLIIHWLANCSQFVKNQTVTTKSKTQHDDPSDS